MGDIVQTKQIHYLPAWNDADDKFPDYRHEYLWTLDADFNVGNTYRPVVYGTLPEELASMAHGLVTDGTWHVAFLFPPLCDKTDVYRVISMRQKVDTHDVDEELVDLEFNGAAEYFESYFIRDAELG